MVSGGQVLYRKWRPQRFDQLVGQDHIGQTLRRAVSEDRIAHAYLFCGPRGTGKTSSARILAKALNCANPSDGEPDDTCDNCVAANEGRMMDLIEMDAASNRRIDDIRSLRDKISFSPSSGRYKVYIIDEVHGLAREAVQALLKTLEEPPAHAVLILATTEVQQVPPTIISRCQRYDFRRISNQAIVERLAKIAGSEGFEVEDDVLAILARKVWGSLRDAENLLDQLTISYGGKVTAEQARDMLGIGDTGSGMGLAGSVLRGDAAGALAVINERASAGSDLRALKDLAVDALRAALLIKTGVEEALSHPAEVVEEMRKAATAVSMERLLHSLTVFGEADLKQDSSSPLPLELAVVHAVAGPPEPAAAGSAQPAAPSRQPTRTPAPLTPARRNPPAPRSAPVSPPQRPVEERQTAQRRPRAPQDPQWDGLIRALSRVRGRRYMLGALLRGASSHEVKGEELTIRFLHRSHWERLQEELDDPVGRRSVVDAATETFGVKLTVRAVHDGTDSGPNSASPPTDSPLVRAAMTMGGRIIDEEPPVGGTR